MTAPRTVRRWTKTPLHRIRTPIQPSPPPRPFGHRQRPWTAAPTPCWLITCWQQLHAQSASSMAIHHTAQARVVLNRIDEWELPDDALSSAYGPEVRKAARQLGYWINRLLAEVGQGGQQQPDVENCQNCGQPPDHPAQHGPGLCYCNPYPPLP